jgi:hypothetical protein
MQNEQRPRRTPVHRGAVGLTSRLQARELELEDLSMRVENEKRAAPQSRAPTRRRWNLWTMHNRKIQAQQSLCKHRKGGKNLEGVS